MRNAGWRSFRGAAAAAMENFGSVDGDWCRVRSFPGDITCRMIHRGSAYVPMIQWPFFQLLNLVEYRLGNALTARSSASFAISDGTEVWLWIGLLLVGSITALIMQRSSARSLHVNRD